MESYTTLLGVRAEIEEILKEMNQTESNPIIEKLDSIKQCIDKLDPEFAYNIYDRCERIKRDFDFLKNNFSDSLKIDVPDNLTNNKHLSVFLMGEFSSGKTTFIQRSLGQKAGEISASPTTGFLTIHKVGNDESLEIVFSDNFEMEKTDFSIFLQKYHLIEYFNLRGNKWKLNDTGIKTLAPEFSAADYMEFLNSANDFPECFKEITWTHKKIGKNSSFFDFADLYDMPGAGAGNEKHDNNINYAFETYIPDIIFYFIDSNNSIPSSDGTELLRNRVLPIMKKHKGNLPSLFFVYELPDKTNDEYVSLNANGNVEFSKTFMKNKADYLDDYINKEHSNENNFKFSSDEREILREACLLDLRGPKKTASQGLHNALACSLQKFYSDKTHNAIDDIIGDLKKFEDGIENIEIIKMVLNKMEDTDDTGINTYLKAIFDEIKQKTDIGKNLSIEGAKEIFQKHFYLSGYGNYNKTSFSKALNRRYEAIDGVINDIIKHFSKSDKTDNVQTDIEDKQIILPNKETLKSVVSKIGETMKSQYNEIRNPKKCISYQKIVDEFQNIYKEKVEWQDLPFMVQSFFALRFSETDDIKNYYLLSTASTFIDYIKRDYWSLEELHTDVPLCKNLNDFVNN